MKRLSNVFIDEKNIFSHYENAIYPVVIKYNCKEKEVRKIEIQKPGYNAFKDL